MATELVAAARNRGCCLSPEGSGCLLTFGGTRWRIWGAAESSNDVSHRDQAEAYSAACWGPGPQQMALGCVSGRVQFWEPFAGEPTGSVAEAFKAIIGGAEAAVTTLVASQLHRAVVFAGCGACPEILEIGVADGATRRTFKAGKANLCQLAIAGTLGAEWLLSAGAGTALRLWHLDDANADQKPKVHTKLAGPATASSCLDLCSVGDQLVAACCDQSMQVDVFCLPSDGGEADPKGAPVAATYVLTCHEYIHRASVLALPRARLAVIGCGPAIMSYWSLGTGKKGKTMPPTFTLASTDIGGRLLSVRSMPEVGLLAAFGPLSQPSFVKVSPPASKDEQPTLEPLSNLASSRVAQAVPKTQEARPKVVEEVEPATTVGPLEATVERQGIKRKHAVTSGAVNDVKLPPDVSVKMEGLSVAPVVRQGLRSKDPGEITEVLKTSDVRVVDRTVAQLSGQEAFDLLQECTKRLMSDQAMSQSVCCWMQRILLRHCAYISSRPLLQRALQPLHDVFEFRCSSYKSLVLLKGRMRAARDGGKQVIARKKLERELVRTPLLEYVEGDEDLPEDDSEEGGEAPEEAAPQESEEEDDDELMAEWLDEDD